MALKDCRECGASVSEYARTCPHCGIGKPVEDVGDTVADLLHGMYGCGCLVVVILVLVGMLASNC